MRNSLRSQLVDDSVARAEFNITVLAAPDQLAADAGAAEFEASGLTDRFLLRGSSGVFVEFADGETFASSLALVAAASCCRPSCAPSLPPATTGTSSSTSTVTRPWWSPGAVRRRVPTSTSSTRRPTSTTPSAQLARVLIAASAGVVLVGALGAGLIARRVLRPVAVAGEAAGRMAEGDLGVRLPADTTDEMGRLAVAFNQMAASLEQQIGALVNAHDRERRFVADVSHELRTPLTALVNEAARLQGSLSGLSATDQRVGEMLVADVARLRRLVEDLLEVSRLDAGQTAPEATVVDLPRFLEAVIADRHPTAALRIDDSSGWCTSTPAPWSGSLATCWTMPAATRPAPQQK